MADDPKPLRKRRPPRRNEIGGPDGFRIRVFRLYTPASCCCDQEDVQVMRPGQSHRTNCHLVKDRATAGQGPGTDPETGKIIPRFTPRGERIH